MRSMMLRWLLPVILLIMSFSPITRAQSERKNPLKDLSQYLRQSWTVQNGLPQNSISTLLQTSDGYLWIATGDNLVRFGGVEFAIYTNENTPVLPHADIRALAEGPDSVLWIGTQEGLLSYKNGIFQVHQSGAQRTQNLISSIAIDPQGVIWAGTNGGGLQKYDHGTFSTYSKNQGLPSNTITSLLRDHEGRLWIGTTNGICFLKDDRVTPFAVNGTTVPGIITSLHHAADHSIWIGTENGLAQFTNGSITLWNTNNGLSDNSIRCIAEDRFGALWIGTEHGGINRLVDGKIQILSTTHGLSSDYITRIIEDREGNIWCSTYYNGIVRLWQGKFLNYSTQQGLLNEQLRTIIQCSDGSIWLGGEEGISRFERNRFQNGFAKDLLPSPYIRSFHEDSRGILWIGTRDGLVRYDHGKSTVLTKAHGLSDENIRSICQDAQDRLLVGTSTEGVERLEGNRFTNLDRLGVPRTYIRALFRDRQRGVWIGSDSGLVLLEHDTVRRFSAHEGAPTSPVYCFYADDDSTLWMGTHGEGIIRYRDGRFTRIMTTEGLFDNTIYQILEDDNNALWMSSNKGLFRIQRQVLNDFAAGIRPRIEGTSFGIADGMLTPVCNGNAQPAGWKARDGNLWFPTSIGAIVIDPNTLPENRLAPPVSLEEIIVDKVKYDHHTTSVFPPGFFRMEFHFAGLSFIAPDQVRFRYKLEGFDEDWIDGTDRTAYYTNIPPGNYTFRVTAANNDGVWNTEGATFRFRLEPYFYQTQWFLLLIGTALLMIIYGWYRLRLLALRKREAELQLRVDEAIAKIKVLHGLLPICAGCKKIRDDKGYWNQIERYIQDHSEASFSHGICPECKEKFYGDFTSRSRD